MNHNWIVYALICSFIYSFIIVILIIIIIIFIIITTIVNNYIVHLAEQRTWLFLVWLYNGKRLFLGTSIALASCSDYFVFNIYFLSHELSSALEIVYIAVTLFYYTVGNLDHKKVCYVVILIQLFFWTS